MRRLPNYERFAPISKAPLSMGTVTDFITTARRTIAAGVFALLLTAAIALPWFSATNLSHNSVAVSNDAARAALKWTSALERAAARRWHRAQLEIAQQPCPRPDLLESRFAAVNDALNRVILERLSLKGEIYYQADRNEPDIDLMRQVPARIKSVLQLESFLQVEMEKLQRCFPKVRSSPCDTPARLWPAYGGYLRPLEDACLIAE
jgi:hypothetical protein